MAKYFNDASITEKTSGLSGYRHSIYNSLGKLYYVEHDVLMGIVAEVALDALPAALVSLNEVEILANELPYGTGADTYGKTSLTSFARTILDDADAAAVQATLGLVIGTNVQAYDAELAAIAGLTSAANKLIRFTGTGTADLLDYSVDTTMASASDTLVYSGLAIKSYIDNLITGLKWKQSVACATTANITLSGEQTIDGVTTSGSRVLVRAQSTASQNGIYVSGAGSWTRATDADAGAELVNATVFVEGGTSYADTQWTCTNNSITIGSTSITWAQVAGSGTYSAGTGLVLTGNQFSIASTVVTSTYSGDVDITGSLDVDDVNINGSTISGTASSDGKLILQGAASGSYMVRTRGATNNGLSFYTTGASTAILGVTSTSNSTQIVGSFNTGTGDVTWGNNHTFTGTLYNTRTTNQLILGTTNTTTISATAPSANRVYTLPDWGADDSFVGLAASQTLTNKTLTTPRIAVIHDSNGNEMLETTTTASAVNHILFTNAITGSFPSITPAGDDANI